MNKYMGFYELRSMNLPTVPWEQFTQDTLLDGSLLWTVRVAVENSNDLNLPRIIGARAEEAEQCGRELLDRFSGRGLVIYYPYFIAEKSGVLDVGSCRTIIEAVDRDLWNLVTYGRKNVTAIFKNVQGAEYSEFHGDRNFLPEADMNELKKYAAVIRGKFRDNIHEGKSILAEWSYAYNTDIGNKHIGSRYLIFYELRSV